MIQVGDRVKDLLENLGAGVVVSKGIVGCSEEGGSSLFVVDFGGPSPQERFSHEILPQRAEPASLPLDLKSNPADKAASAAA